jgi:predicted transcriptional regulator
MRTHKMWTKSEFNELVRLWNTSDMETIVRKLGRSRPTIQAVIRKLRSAGVDVPKKRISGYIDTLVNDFAADYKKHR